MITQLNVTLAAMTTSLPFVGSSKYLTKEKGRNSSFSVPEELNILIIYSHDSFVEAKYLLYVKSSAVPSLSTL